VNKYLGMTLDYSTRHLIKILMIDYVKDIIAAWDKSCAETDSDSFKFNFRKSRGTPTAAPSNLFVMNEDSIKLPETQKAGFHNVVAKALYVAKRARPDIAVAISYLTTRVRNPDIDDWSKLHHLIEYLRSTIDMPLTLGDTSGGVLHWYVDAAFAVHPNMRGHSGGALTLGIGFMISSLGKQKLNMWSSTESELVGVNDLMSLILWSRIFLKAQGYVVVDNILHQGNKSAILLEQNGKMSSRRGPKHHHSILLCYG
jgi:hypothetical protein